MSERIRVRSIVGRFLEHSRLYYFANGGQADVYLGSADLMARNLDRRVETLCRVRDRRICDHLRKVVLDSYLRDDDRAYRLIDDRNVPAAPPPGEPPLGAQRFLLDWYTSGVRDPGEQ